MKMVQYRKNDYLCGVNDNEGVEPEANKLEHGNYYQQLWSSGQSGQ